MLENNVEISVHTPIKLTPFDRRKLTTDFAGEVFTFHASNIIKQMDLFLLII